MIIFWKLKRLMLRMEMIGVDENDNKPELKDASHDNVDDFDEDTCEVCLYDVENVVHSTENNVGCKSCLKTIETNKAESKDTTKDKVEIFYEYACNVCLIFVLCRIFCLSKVRALPLKLWDCI